MSCENVRAKRLMLILWMSAPKTGSLSCQRFQSSLPVLVLTKYLMPKNTASAVPMKTYQSLRMRSLRSTRNCVGAGRGLPKSLKISANTGTTFTIRKIVMSMAMEMTAMG